MKTPQKLHLPEGDLMAFEESILRDQEPSANYQKVDVPGISQGRQSRVTVLEFKLSQGAEAVVWKRMGVGKGLTEQEAELLHDRLRKYRRSLRDLGWNIPKLFHTHTVQVGSEWQIYSYEQFIPGGDADFAVRDALEPNYRKWQLLRAAIETLGEYPERLLKPRVLCDREVTALPHGLDLKLANLVSDGSIVYFVDLFGPKELTSAGDWLSYTPKLDGLPQENLLAVTATREGAILRLFRLAEKSWIESGSAQKDAIRSELESVLTQSGIPQRERDFILIEIDNEYPWLDELYAESAV
ncbi:hypothetical protein [Amycolatopsis silviterrae]|uniref:Aminoglycoside phosphotransferase domain-containing protein n=1 Tax=Amycolatopsis silviterrae TaxID=1656914 RepID=A0ABW5H057_9PSEU